MNGLKQISTDLALIRSPICRSVQASRAEPS